MREVMWEHMGLMREESGLLRVLSEVATLRERAARVGVKGGAAYNLAWQHWLNLRNQLLVSELIARSALARRESRGSHYRRDFPEPDPAWLANVLVRAGGECVKVWTAPVGFTRYTPDGRPAIAVSVETR
jgi:succinate dehydrogenase/fumarate reductase flavoprotein subunit